MTTTTSSPERTTNPPVAAGELLWAMSPWLLFGVMTHRLGVAAVGWAAVVAVAFSVLLAGRRVVRGHRLTVVDAAGPVTFGVLTTAAFLGGPGLQPWLADYGRGGAALVLALLMLASVPLVPFTEQLARGVVHREVWQHPAFRAVNRRISAAWGLAVLGMAACHLAATVVDPVSDPRPGARPVDLVLNWAVPVALVLLAVSRTERLVAQAGPVVVVGSTEAPSRA